MMQKTVIVSRQSWPTPGSFWQLMFRLTERSLRRPPRTRRSRYGTLRQDSVSTHSRRTMIRSGDSHFRKTRRGWLVSVTTSRLSYTM